MAAISGQWSHEVFMPGVVLCEYSGPQGVASRHAHTSTNTARRQCCRLYVLWHSGVSEGRLKSQLQIKNDYLRQPTSKFDFNFFVTTVKHRH